MQFYRLGSYALILIGFSHLSGHFILFPYFKLKYTSTDLISLTVAEVKLLEQMNTYHRNIGGTLLSLMDIQNGLSLCYALFFFWIGFLNLMLFYNLTNQTHLLKKISLLNVVLLLFGVMISGIYFFWLPIASFALTLFFFLGAYLRLNQSA